MVRVHRPGLQEGRGLDADWCNVDEGNLHNRGERAKRASLDENSSDKSREMSTDGYIHY